MKQLTENVLQLGNRHFNYFAVGRQEAAVIDCGVTGGVQSLKKEWRDLPYQPDVRYLIPMHAHFDHVCGLLSLRELFPRAEVIGSAETRRILGKAKILDNFFYQDRQMSQFLVEEGILETEPAEYTPTELTVDRVVGEGDTINLEPGLQLQILAAPGHSPCGLACYLPGDEVMFISDAAGMQISDTEIFPIFFQSYTLYMETLERLRSFPARVVAVAHETVWTRDDVFVFYERALAAARAAHANITRMLHAGWEEERIQQTLFAHYYHGNLRMYTPDNIQLCVELLIRRVKEDLIAVGM